MDVGNWEGEVKLVGEDGTSIREYGSTLYVGMTRVKNGGRIKRVH